MKKNILSITFFCFIFFFLNIFAIDFDYNYLPVPSKELSKSHILYNAKGVLRTKQLPYITQVVWQEIVDPQSKIVYSIPTNIYDMTAKQIAGFYVSKKFQNSKVFADYLTFVTEKWNALNNISLSKIDEWTEKYISPCIKGTETVFYPLGGPDAAYVLKFFPHATCYILIGLESTGNFFQVKRALNNEESFLLLKEALTWYLNKGYFITSEMMTQLHKKNLSGTLPIILFGLSRMNAKIENITDYSIDPFGTTIKKTKKAPNCVCISFYYQEKKRYLYYIPTNLENKTLILNNVFNFVKKFKFVTFLKSASYILYDRHFSRLLNFILNYSTGILQDDTGIPFSAVNNNLWKKTGFGKYTEPTLQVFKAFKQPDLEKFFNTQQINPIPFKIGYGFSRNRPNLLFLLRKTPVNYFFNNPLNFEKIKIQYSIK